MFLGSWVCELAGGLKTGGYKNVKPREESQT
jgi:hypothetical protein